MTITDDFVFLHMPKTGSSFTMTVLIRAYRQKYKWRNRLSRLGVTTPPIKELYMQVAHTTFNRETNHGAYCQIPALHLDKPIYSVVRSPFELILSVYRYAAWRQRPEAEAEKIRAYIPSFPNLTFKEMMDYLREDEILAFQRKSSHRVFVKQLDIGPQTVKFIDMFAKNPPDFYEKLHQRPSYIDEEEAVSEIADIHFLQQESLRTDLINMLNLFGHRKEELLFIQAAKKVNTTSLKTDNYTLTPSDIAMIRHQERFVFRCLKSRGIEY